MRAEILHFRNEEAEIFVPYGLGTQYLGDALFTGAHAELTPTIFYGHGGLGYGTATLTAYIPFANMAASWAINALAVDASATDAFQVLWITSCETLKAMLQAGGMPGALMCTRES